MVQMMHFDQGGLKTGLILTKIQGNERGREVGKVTRTETESGVGTLMVQEGTGIATGNMTGSGRGFGRGKGRGAEIVTVRAGEEMIEKEKAAGILGLGMLGMNEHGEGTRKGRERMTREGRGGTGVLRGTGEGKGREKGGMKTLIIIEAAVLGAEVVSLGSEALEAQQRAIQHQIT
jgi:hypothetical protein